MTPRDEAATWAAEQWKPSWPVNPHITEEQRYRHTWAKTLIDRGRGHGDIPQYGTREWAELPDDDPRKAAAVVRAAECWAREGDDLGFTLLAEDKERRRADDEHWQRVYAGRQQIKDNVIDRMGRVDARANPRTSRDAQAGYTGGPVDWEANEGGDHDTVRDRRTANAA